MGTPTGLRERKKTATRTALSDAALRLAVEVGTDNVTADAIAAAANVSTRTFHNYFSSKDEAILNAMQEQFRALILSMHARPPDEPIWQVLEETALSSLGRAGGSDTTMALRRMLESPALIAEHLGLFDEMQRMSVEAIAERTGTDVETDLYPHLMSAMAAAAMRAAIGLWERGGREADLTDLVRQAFAQARAGTPPPPGS